MGRIEPVTVKNLTAGFTGIGTGLASHLEVIQGLLSIVLTLLSLFWVVYQIGGEYKRRKSDRYRRITDRKARIEAAKVQAKEAYKRRRAKKYRSPITKEDLTL